MAITITTQMCDTFKKEILMGTHLFKAAGGNTFKLCLLKAQAAGAGTYGTASTNYTDVTGNSDEATDTSGNNRYTAGGFTMVTNADPTISNNIAYIDWATDPNWGTDATITSYGGMLYNSSASGAAVATLAWGADKTCTTGTFTVTLPAPASATALIRI
jgi:hypothetical protein